MLKIFSFLMIGVLLISHPPLVLASYNIGNGIKMGTFSLIAGHIPFTALDASTEQLAFKYLATTTSPITDIDFYMDITGTVTGINFVVEVQTSSSDAPSGTVLGSASTAFSGLAADGWTGLKTLASNTGNLTFGTFYWIVVRVSSGSPDGSNYIQVLYGNNVRTDLGLKVRHYNGTDWTTTTAVFGIGSFVVKHADGTYSGFGSGDSGINASSSATDIYNTNKQGLKIKFGSPVKILGVRTILNIDGSPGTLTIRVYEGSTEKYSSPGYSAASMQDDTFSTFLFSSPVLLAADTNLYIIFEQSGVSNSNVYSLDGLDYVSTYKTTIMPTNWDFVYGSGSDPTTFTAETDWGPAIDLIIEDPASDLSGKSVWFDSTLYDTTLN